MSLVVVILATSPRSIANNMGPLLIWILAYLAVSATIIVARKKINAYSWSVAPLLVSDTIFVIKIFTNIGSLESYLIYAYFFLIATFSLNFGLKGSLSTALSITVFDYFYTHINSASSLLYSPMALRIGLSWLAAIALGLASRRMSGNQDKIQQLNKELDSKVTVLVSASRVLGSINDLDKLIDYFQETLARIFGINEHALIIKSSQQTNLILICNTGLSEDILADNLFYLKDDLLITGVDMTGLGIAVGATHKGTQGFYLLLVKSGDTQIILNDQDIFRTIFGQFILAIDNALLTQKAKEASLTDHLTGLYNQRYFYERVNEEISRASRNSSNLSLLMLDIDNFKAFNDSYGHLSGDKALAKIAQTINVSCRESDIAARYGGEEFVVILPDTDDKEAINVAERILEGVRGKSLQDANGQQLPGLTVSIGISTYPKHGLNAVEVLERADKALYRAKATGKNRAILARKKRSVENQKPARDLRGA